MKGKYNENVSVDATPVDYILADMWSLYPIIYVHMLSIHPP